MSLKNKISFLFSLLSLVSSLCYAKNVANPTAKQILIAQAKNGNNDTKKILDVEAELKAYSEAKLGKGFHQISESIEILEKWKFENGQWKELKLINGIWK